MKEKTEKKEKEKEKEEKVERKQFLGSPQKITREEVTLCRVTAIGTLETSRALTSSESSEISISLFPSASSSTVTVGILVFARAARTPIMMASKRFPPKSSTRASM